MKTIYTLAIALMAGVILTACVGAVTLPAGIIAEAKTEKTEAEIQTPKKLVIKEQEPQNIITTEPTPISANPCIANPFGNACSVEFDFIRELACRHESDSERCAPTIARICNANPFDSFCNTDFNNAREIACAGEPNSERCVPIIAQMIKRVCGADSLDVLCDGNKDYYNARINACVGKQNFPLCVPIIAQACEENPYGYAWCNKRESIITECLADVTGDWCRSAISDVCEQWLDTYAGNRGHNSRFCYQLSRKLDEFEACGGEITSPSCVIVAKRLCNTYTHSIYCGKIPAYLARVKTCGYLIYSDSCTQTIAQICPETPFDDLLCDADIFNNDRELACADELFSERCAPTIARVCTAGSLDILCQAQETACAGEPDSQRCAPIIRRVCDADSLDTLCNGVTAYFSRQYSACATSSLYTGRAIQSERCAPTIARVCSADVFNPYCQDVESYEPARETACRDASGNVAGRYYGGRLHRDLCKSVKSRICTINANPFDLICSDESYLPKRKIVCASELESERCAPTITLVCDANALDLLCEGNTTYYPEQERRCRYPYYSSQYSSFERCASTVTRICTADPTSTSCFLGVYADAHKIACTAEPNKDSCFLATLSCRSKPLEEICIGYEDSYSAQEEICRRERNSERCAPVITRICDADSLNDFCSGNATYFTAQKSACVGDNSDSRCDRIIMNLCYKIPFDTLCQSKNLTRLDFGGSHETTTGNSIRTACGNYSYRGSANIIHCFAYIPSVIDIKPLNNANTGIATYSGSILLQAASFDDGGSSHNKNIDIIADFDNNTLTYSGNFDPSAQTLGPAILNPFSINGNFTDRGIITGSVNFRGITGSLNGLIGQNKTIGAFSRNGNGGQASFAGGFIATREEE